MTKKSHPVDYLPEDKVFEMAGEALEKQAAPVPPINSANGGRIKSLPGHDVTYRYVVRTKKLPTGFRTWIAIFKGILDGSFELESFTEQMPA